MMNPFVKIIATNADTQDEVDLGYGLKSGDGPREYPIQTNGMVLDYFWPDEETKQCVLKEAEDWIIEDHYDHKHYNEGHDSLSEEKGISPYTIRRFGAPIIVKDGHFYGVAIHIESTSGNGWVGYNRGNYCLQLIDGTILGPNESNYHFSGEETETTKKDIYYLKKIEK